MQGWLDAVLGHGLPCYDLRSSLQRAGVGPGAGVSRMVLPSERAGFKILQPSGRWGCLDPPSGGLDLWVIVGCTGPGYSPPAGV